MRLTWGAPPGPQVRLLRIEGGGHAEPTLTHPYGWLYRRLAGEQNRDVESAEEAWRFFRGKPGLDRFSTARRTSLGRLRQVLRLAWGRRGVQEHVGPVTLDGVLASMLDHDRGHAREIAALLRELGADVPAGLRDFASEEPLRLTA